MILVTIGTHPDPCDRLVRAAEALAVGTGEEVVIQRGASREPAPHCVVHDLLPHRELMSLMRRARLVVTHAAPASILEAVAAGHIPLVIPRDPAHGEHVDDHQIRFARFLRSRVHLVEDPADLARAVADHDELCRGMLPPRAAGAEAAARVGALVEVLVDARRARPGRFRATLSHLLRQGRAPR